jgi:hypothetical protein
MRVETAKHLVLAFNGAALLAQCFKQARLGLELDGHNNGLSLRPISKTIRETLLTRPLFSGFYYLLIACLCHSYSWNWRMLMSSGGAGGLLTACGQIDSTMNQKDLNCEC